MSPTIMSLKIGCGLGLFCNNNNPAVSNATSNAASNVERGGGAGGAGGGTRLTVSVPLAELLAKFEFAPPE